MMAIVMSGGVYCPLSSHDPQHRQHQLLQQAQNRLMLVHWLTKTNFQNHSMIVDIDQILINDKQEKNNDADMDLLSDMIIIITPESMAYIIFTSGSTGTPKAVSIQNLLDDRYMIEMIVFRSKFDIAIPSTVYNLSYRSVLGKRKTMSYKSVAVHLMPMYKRF